MRSFLFEESEARWCHADAALGHSGSVRTQQFAHRVELDKARVKAGLTWSINNGVVEGKVNKLKLLKRMGYRRADVHSYVSECFMLFETISCFGGSHAS